jgi:L-asparaginase
MDHNPRALFRTAALACVAVAALTASSTTAIAQNNLPVCPLIATGGTIAMKIDPVKKAPVPAISGEDLVATVPDVTKYAKVEVHNVSNVPSDYMDPPRWVALTGEVNRALARPEELASSFRMEPTPLRRQRIARPHDQFRETYYPDRCAA